MSMSHRRPPARRGVACWLGLLLAAAVGSQGAACSPGPKGPVFAWAAAPDPARGRVYLYRADERPSLAIVRTTIDGREVGTFRNGEYETLELSAGRHRLRAGMRGLAFFSLGWNQHTFHLEPGEIRFLHLDVRLAVVGESAVGRPSELEIGGRSDQKGAENVFIGERTRAEATPDLEVSTRLPASD